MPKGKPKLTHIERSIRTLAVPIDSVKEDPRNARRHPRRNLDEIRASLSRFGQVKPIVIDSAGRVIAGNGMLRAAKLLGWREIAAVRTRLTGTMADAFGIADNRTGELSEWDDAALAELIRELQAEGLERSTGFDEREIDRLLSALDPEGALGEIQDFQIQPPPKMTWVLLGIPIDEFAEARGPLAQLEEIAAIKVEVSKDA